MSSKIKLNSRVRVITGKDKGKEGLIIEINRKHSLVKVAGAHLVTKHYKARQQNEKSEIKVFESYIHISNVALIAAA
jgi:large subunit ribosomal protein L24